MIFVCSLSRNAMLLHLRFVEERKTMERTPKGAYWKDDLDLFFFRKKGRLAGKESPKISHEHGKGKSSSQLPNWIYWRATAHAADPKEKTWPFRTLFQRPQKCLTLRSEALKKDDAMMPLPGAASVEVATSSAKNSLEHSSETAPRSSVVRGCETAEPQQDSSPNLRKPSPAKLPSVAFWSPY